MQLGQNSELRINTHEQFATKEEQQISNKWGNCRAYWLNRETLHPRILIGPDIVRPLVVMLCVVTVWLAFGLFVRHSPLWLQIVIHTCSAIQLLSWAGALLVNPPIVQRGSTFRTSTDTVSQMYAFCQVRRCPICDIIVDNDIYHCKECDACCDGYDHHCQWLGKCVGRQNLPCFNVFIRAAMIGLVFDLLSFLVD